MILPNSKICAPGTIDVRAREPAYNHIAAVSHPVGAVIADPYHLIEATVVDQRADSFLWGAAIGIAAMLSAGQCQSFS
jgi:hypothetical protein